MRKRKNAAGIRPARLPEEKEVKRVYTIRKKRMPGE